jgi:hypothetical protein
MLLSLFENEIVCVMCILNSVAVNLLKTSKSGTSKNLLEARSERKRDIRNFGGKKGGGVRKRAKLPHVLIFFLNPKLSNYLLQP